MPKAIFTIPAPVPTDRTAVMAMRGHTMGAIEDGWLLFYEHNESPPTEAIHGQLCVVKTADDRLLTRKVRKGWKPDRWDLETVSGEQLFDQMLVWAEPITLIKPHKLTEEEKRLIVEARAV